MKKATVIPIDVKHDPVSYYVHENLRAQMVSANTKWFILVLVLIVLLVATNATYHNKDSDQGFPPPWLKVTCDCHERVVATAS